jgi:hypothetical protein
VRPVYAPALGAFVGRGAFHFSANFGGGPGIAWFPLAPGEVFIPGYHVSRYYVNQVNVTNTVVHVTRVTDVYNYYTTNNRTVINRITYANQTVPNAVTAVSHDTFVSARPVGRNVVALQPREIAQAPVAHMPVVEPVRTSVIGAGQPAKVAPPAAIVNRQVVAQHIPAAPTTPFAQRQDKLIARPVTVRPVAPVAGQTNLRQQTPGTAHELNRPEAPVNREQPSASQPVVRWEKQGPPPAQPPATQYEPRPESTPSQATRPGTAQPPRQPQPSPEATREQPARANQPQGETRQGEGWSHPLARPAPAVQPKSQQQAQQAARISALSQAQSFGSASPQYTPGWMGTSQGS